MNVGYAKAIEFKRKLDLMIQQKTLEIIWVSEEIAEQAWIVFERYNTDKLWSFTDCVSYIVMQSQNLTEVFGFDHHFAQMGFVCCP